jgi:Tol biopolymer transport system component
MSATRPFMRPLIAATVALGVLVTSSSDAAAQYFGQNKVQYKNLDFEVLKTEHFDIYYYPSAREGINIAARMSERWLARLERVLEHQLRGRQPLVLYASHPDFEQTNVIQGSISEGTGGVTESMRRRIILPLGGPLADTDHVIGHELVHAFQFDITTRPGAAAGETGAHYLPLWFIEGMAEYLSIGPVDSNTAMWLRDAARQEKLPTVRELNDPRYFPYRWGQAFWSYVAGKWGDGVVRQMLSIAAAAGDPEVAIRRVLGLSAEELSQEWHSAIRRTYEPFMAASMPPREVGTAILTADPGAIAGKLNVAPAISPDGKLIAFLSERSVFSIDLYVAEAATGKVLRKLTSSATDPHFSSIQFIHSAGAWDAASERIAIATVVSGRPALAIFNARTGDKDREVPLPTLDEIFNPTWSPDGRTVAFTAMTRGLTDLFLLDLETSALKQLTADPYAELQPDWSPDGKLIAFATDRFSSKLDVLSIGPYRLAIVDPATGAITQVGAFTGGKNINPQWAPDSQALYFLSDRDGIPNIYRVTLGGDLTQVTNVGTGISGITGTSPALSVASLTGLAAFTVYDGGNHHIHTLDLSGPAGRGKPVGEGSMTAATLPPLERRESDVVALLANAEFGLPAPPDDVQAEDYKAGLGLEAIGQPTIAVGASRFGAAIGGGLALYFTDMLGDQALGVGFQINSGVTGGISLKDTAVQVGYRNMKNRINWGFGGGQIPYRSAGFRAGYDSIGGQPAYVEETVLFRQVERSAYGVMAYPLNRAQRLEFSAGGSQISFEQEIRTQAFSLNTGNLIFDETETFDVAESVRMATTSAALVFDTSVFGPTSPVQGQRYRFEASPSIGDLTYTGVLLDYRRYFMPAPFYTLATRLMHYGRYGTNADDTRLYPVFVGYPNLVRGYDTGTFEPSECVPDLVSDCPVFDQLVGSRMLVANVELRFPLLRPFGSSSGMYGPLPVEVALFADAGAAWQQDDTLDIFGGGRREPVASVGASLRANLLGFLVAQVDFTHPLSRPRKDFVFQFSLSPGGF